MTRKSTLVWIGSVDDIRFDNANQLRINDYDHVTIDGFRPLLCFKHKAVRDILLAIHKPNDGFTPDVSIKSVVNYGFSICSANIICDDGIVNISYKFKEAKMLEPYFEDPDDDRTYIDDYPEDTLLVFYDINIAVVRRSI